MLRSLSWSQKLRDRFQSSAREVVLPGNPGQVVNKGAAMFALRQSMVQERCVRAGFGLEG